MRRLEPSHADEGRQEIDAGDDRVGSALPDRAGPPRDARHAITAIVGWIALAPALGAIRALVPRPVVGRENDDRVALKLQGLPEPMRKVPLRIKTMPSGALSFRFASEAIRVTSSMFITRTS